MSLPVYHSFLLTPPSIVDTYGFVHLAIYLSTVHVLKPLYLCPMLLPVPPLSIAHYLQGFIICFSCSAVFVLSVLLLHVLILPFLIVKKKTVSFPTVKYLLLSSNFQLRSTKWSKYKTFLPGFTRTRERASVLFTVLKQKRRDIDYYKSTHLLRVLITICIA